jgi:hypothetical protein
MAERTKESPLKEIASRILSHLKRFEKDPIINKADPQYKTRPYFWSNVSVRGRRIMVTYVSYQGSSSLTRQEAADYLAWLDAGNVGCHYEMKTKESA